MRHQLQREWHRVQPAERRQWGLWGTGCSLQSVDCGTPAAAYRASIVRHRLQPEGWRQLLGTGCSLRPFSYHMTTVCAESQVICALPVEGFAGRQAGTMCSSLRLFVHCLWRDLQAGRQALCVVVSGYLCTACGGICRQAGTMCSSLRLFVHCL